MMYRFITVFVCGLFLTLSAYAGDKSQTASAQIRNTKGQNVGKVTLTETPHGVLIMAELWNMPQGTHAFHIHEKGTCEAPFKSAGGHFNPSDREHGILNPKGMHAGDLPNIHIPPDGKLTIEVFNPQVTLRKGRNSLFDSDGSSIVIHDGPDDYKTNPAGAAGPRIACGVIERD